jgi:CelD/BcsL family acetyltransferase involved in cellulose biosynthesis
LSQYHDVLVEAGDVGDALLEGALDFVRGLPHDVLTLRRVREDSRLAAALRAANARVLRSEQAPFIDFGGAKTFEAFERGLSSKERANRRRRLRQIQQLGEIAFESPTAPECVDALIAVAMAFKREWALKGGHYAPALFDARFERCFRDAARAENPNATLRVFAIRLDGRPIGVEISYGFRDRLFGHVLAPDPALAKFGLGAALADAAIADAFAQGFRVYDLLAPANAYKFAWTSRAVEVTDYSLTATRRGALAEAILARAKQVGRRWIQRAPPSLVRALLSRVERRHGDR